MMAAMNTRQCEFAIPSAAAGTAGIRTLGSGFRINDDGRRTLSCTAPQVGEIVQ
jgi:hypothetical protein